MLVEYTKLVTRSSTNMWFISCYIEIVSQSYCRHLGCNMSVAGMYFELNISKNSDSFWKNYKNTNVTDSDI